MILIVDWPSRDVPDTLARAGYSVIVKGGPEPDNYSAYEVQAGDVARRPLGRAPEYVDLVYCHRPLAELPDLARLAKTLGARTVWLQSGRTAACEKDPKGCWLPDQQARDAKEMVNALGLAFVCDAYIADVVRTLTA